MRRCFGVLLGAKHLFAVQRSPELMRRPFCSGAHRWDRLRALASELLELVVVGIVVEEAELMMLGASGDQEKLLSCNRVTSS